MVEKDSFEMMGIYVIISNSYFTLATTVLRGSIVAKLSFLDDFQ